MLKQIKPSPFIKDVGLTAVTSGITIISIIIVTRLLAQGLGTEKFRAYAMSRQILSTLVPFYNCLFYFYFFCFKIFI
jgi:hypothetical protein